MLGTHWMPRMKRGMTTREIGEEVSAYGMLPLIARQSESQAGFDS